MPREYFPKVKEAREALREKALALFKKYEEIIDKAIADGKFEVAAEHTRWLIEHMPAEDGERVIDPSAAKPKEAKGIAGPSIQIGFQLGGMNSGPSVKTLPKVVEIPSEETE